MLEILLLAMLIYGGVQAYMFALWQHAKHGNLCYVGTALHVYIIYDQLKGQMYYIL